jgi:hypothetical protein
MTNQRQDLGHCMNDGIEYDDHRQALISGSFRKALRDYGFDKKQIDRVIDRSRLRPGRHRSLS